jgi:hypothetical protein
MRGRFLVVGWPHVIPDRIRWAVETLDVEPGDRLLEIGGGPGVAALLVCERLDRGSMFLIDRSATAIERTRRRNEEHVSSGQLTLKTVDVADFDPGLLPAPEPRQHERCRILRSSDRPGHHACTRASDERPRGGERPLGANRPRRRRSGAMALPRQPEDDGLRLRAGRQLPVQPAVGRPPRPALGAIAHQTPLACGGARSPPRPRSRLSRGWLARRHQAVLPRT